MWLFRKNNTFWRCQREDSCGYIISEPQLSHRTCQDFSARLQESASSHFGTNFRADAIQVRWAFERVYVCQMKPVALELQGGWDKNKIDCVRHLPGNEASSNRWSCEPLWWYRYGASDNLLHTSWIFLFNKHQLLHFCLIINISLSHQLCNTNCLLSQPYVEHTYGKNIKSSKISEYKFLLLNNWYNLLNQQKNLIRLQNNTF